MEYGLHLPHAGRRVAPARVVEVAQAAERLGFHSVWCYDHLFTPVDPPKGYPGAADGAYRVDPATPYLDPIVVLAAVAGATERVHLGTRVLIPTYRSPVVLAKQLASLDALAGGRVLLGVGVGWMREEFDAVDVPFAERAARFEEHLAVMRQAWQQGISEFDGEYYSHVEAGFFPQPPRPGNGIPLVLGGHSRRALRRVAEQGDGWAVMVAAEHVIAATGSARPDAVARSLGVLREECDRVGRDYDELLLVGAAAFNDDPELFGAYAELGIDICDLMSFAGPDRVMERAEEFMDDVGVELA